MGWGGVRGSFFGEGGGRMGVISHNKWCWIDCDNKLFKWGALNFLRVLLIRVNTSIYCIYEYLLYIRVLTVYTTDTVYTVYTRAKILYSWHQQLTHRKHQMASHISPLAHLVCINLPFKCTCFASNQLSTVPGTPYS